LFGEFEYASKVKNTPLFNCYRLSDYFHATCGMALFKFFKWQEKPSEGNSLLSRTEVEIANKAVPKALVSALKDFHSLSHNKYVFGI